MIKASAYKRGVQYLLYAVMIITVAMINIPGVPMQMELDPIEETCASTVETRINSELISAPSAFALSDEALLEEYGISYEKDEDYDSVAAMWVDGKSVPMTAGQVAEFEKKLYECKTQEEYEAMMNTLQHYEKGVDLSRFDWYWDEMEDLYSDDQIAQLKSGQSELLIVPDVVGMKSREAYSFLRNLGFIVRVSYYYNPDCDLPVDYCYWQDAQPGTMWKSDSGIMLLIQAPVEIIIESIQWDPDDEDFDINLIAQDIRENGRYSVIVPNVVGLHADEAKRRLEEAGFKNVIITYMVNDSIAPGYCFDQLFTPGKLIYNTLEFRITARELHPYFVVPDVIGLSEAEAVAALAIAGFSARIIYVDDPSAGVDEGICIGLDCTPGSTTQELSIAVTIQAAAQPQETAQTDATIKNTETP